MKIYTRTGDEGETGLFGGRRVSKGDLRLHAYGTVDELNAILGIVLGLEIESELRLSVERIQHELFVVGGDLATPVETESGRIERASRQATSRLEEDIDRWGARLPPLGNFILPGGGMSGAYLHQARTVCRRAERWIVMLNDSDTINVEVLRYMNRLSDWLFVAARVANLAEGREERIWRLPNP
jgi:cob(I)alamin adenosyltransferase